MAGNWLTRALGMSSAAGAPAQLRTLPDPATAVATAQWDRLDQLGIARGGAVNWWGGYGSTLTTKQAMSIPSFARVTSLFSGLVRQCPLDRWVDDVRVDRPRLLKAPDPNKSRSWFVGQQLTDYLIHGNAVAYVTVRGADSWPLAAIWLPARRVYIDQDSDSGLDRYWFDNRRLRTRDVIHVQRGADEDQTSRGVGLIEQHCATLRRAGDQESHEAGLLNSGGVPSVAVTSPNPQVTQEELDLAKTAWLEKYGGPVRVPGLFPAGTQITTLGWSPADSELTAARAATLTDVANLANIDGYWLGAPAGGLTYRSPGQKYFEFLRQSLEPILADFEGAWSAKMLPYGSEVKFDRQVLLSDDLESMVRTWVHATGGPVATTNEARAAMRMKRYDDPAADTLNEPTAPAVTLTNTGGTNEGTT